MSALVILLTLVPLVVALTAMVSRDGYGGRPAPRSHPRDAFEPFGPGDRDLPDG